jgi:hypothetical protein
MEFQNKYALETELVKISKEHPLHYITASVLFGEVTFYYHFKKPTFNSEGAETSYRFYGGFHKNGKVVKPAKRFVDQFNFWPTAR